MNSPPTTPPAAATGPGHYRRHYELKLENLSERDYNWIRGVVRLMADPVWAKEMEAVRRGWMSVRYEPGGGAVQLSFELFHN